MSELAPRAETSEPAHQHLWQSVVREAVNVRQVFGNWLPLLAAIALGRLRARPPQLHMHLRHGPTLHTPGDERRWWTAVVCFGRNCYRLGTDELPSAPLVVDIGANIGAFSLAVLGNIERHRS